MPSFVFFAESILSVKNDLETIITVYPSSLKQTAILLRYADFFLLYPFFASINIILSAFSSSAFIIGFIFLYFNALKRAVNEKLITAKGIAATKAVATNTRVALVSITAMMSEAYFINLEINRYLLTYRDALVKKLHIPLLLI